MPNPKKWKGRKGDMPLEYKQCRFSESVGIAAGRGSKQWHE